MIAIQVQCMYVNYAVWDDGLGGLVDYFSNGGWDPNGKCKNFGGEGIRQHIGRMWHCGMNVAYPRLSDWTLLWALHS